MEELTIEGWYEHNLNASILGEGIAISIRDEMKIISKSEARQLGEWLIKSSEEQ